MDMHISVV